MPLSDVNQVTSSLNTLQLRELSNLSSSAQHINTLGKSNKHTSMSSSSCVLGRQGNQNAAALSPEEGIVKLLERTKYTFVQENGQRRYGPPPNWRSEPPPRGCEVFIGKIPRDCFEDELIPVFEKIGPIYMFRLMMEFNGSNRGYGFCVYANREDTKRAVQELDNYEIRKGKTIGVCFSVDNCRLFVGGIPKSKTRDEILTEMKRVTEGVKDVISYPSVNDKSKNRGFAFVEYESHKAAAMARRKLIPGRIQLWGQQIAVDWAEPEREVNEDIMSKVKILYVRNLMVSTTEESLREHFIRVAGGDASCVERVKKINDYAFIHFKEREQAAKCLQALNDTTLEGSKIEVTWAKPVDKNEVTARQQSTRASSKLMNELVLGKELGINNSLNPAAVVAASGLLPPLDSTLPFILSSVGQQPLAPDLLSINPAAVSSMSASMNLSSPNGPRTNNARTGRRNAAGSRSAGIQRDRKHPIEKQQQRQVNPFICFEILEELARHGEWGPPIYTATPVEMIDQATGGKLQFFMGQVILPNLRLQYAAPRYYSSPEEAKLGACEAAILNIQYNLMMPGDLDLNSISSSLRDSTIQPLLSYHEGKPLPLPVPTALATAPCGTAHSSNATFIPVTSNALSNTAISTSVENLSTISTASALNRTVHESSTLVPITNTASSTHQDSVGSYAVMSSGPNVTSSSSQQTSASSCTPSVSNVSDQSHSGSTRTETTRSDKAAISSNTVMNSRPCAYLCAQPNQNFNVSQFGSTANPQLVCPPTQSNTTAGVTIQPNLTSSMQQVAYAPYTSYRAIQGPPPVSPYQSINYPSCTAFTGNYVLPVGSNVVTSAPTFLPIPLQNAGSSTSNALGLLQTQSNGISISTPSNISTPATIALNSSVVLPDCPSHLAMNGYEYSSLIPGSLATTNLVNPYGNPSAYLVDSNTVLMGSSGQLSGLPAVVTMPQTSVNGTTDLIHHASVGQSGPLSASQVPQTGLYRLSLPVHAVQTPPTQLNPVIQNQAALLGLLSQTQAQSVPPGHSSNSCQNGSVSTAQTLPSTGTQPINVPAAV